MAEVDDSADPPVEQPDAHSIAAAQGMLAQLHAQADQLRTELVRLREEAASLETGATEVRAVELREANEHLVLAALHAETIARAAEENLSDVFRASQHDDLTELPNRALMRDRLENAVASAARHGSRLAVLFVDLDHFKNINDTMGHVIGDQVLQLMARRLESAVRDSDTVSRYGGEEFLVLLPEISAVSDARLVAEKISAQLAAPSRVSNGMSVHVSASIGIAIYPDDGEDAAVLISRADAAMYRSKRRRRGAFEFYSADTSAANHDDAGSLDVVRALPEQDVPPDENRSRLCDLSEANERLLMATLTAQGLEAQSADTRRRHVSLQSVVAHALRLPLAQIRIATAMLESFRTDEAMLAPLPALMQRNVSQMAALIDELLDASHASAENSRSAQGIVELTDIIAMAIAIAEPLVALKNQHLTSCVSPAPMPVFGESVALTQALVNLLYSASKSTPARSEITLMLEESTHKVSITLSGSHKGIAANMSTRISDLYAKITRAVVRRRSRLEVSLAQVRAIVELHGGSVAIASAGSDRGSQFVMTLRRAGTSDVVVAEPLLDPPL